jgi:REP element-mobilizing transposase RayT
LKIRRGLPSLRSARFVRAFEATLRNGGCERGRFRVVHWSVQRDHLHLIVEASSAFDLGCGMKSVGVRVARAVQKVFGLGRGCGAVLRDRFHLHVLRSPREVRRAIAYVLLNARRHAAQRGVALHRRPVRIDVASSGRWFDGWRRGGGDADPSPRDRDGPGVARARSWLLSIGWRRAGLIDVAEVPGPRTSLR